MYRYSWFMRLRTEKGGEKGGREREREPCFSYKILLNLHYFSLVHVFMLIGRRNSVVMANYSTPVGEYDSSIRGDGTSLL